MENIVIDEVVEVEFWINMGNQSNGKIYGCDYGIRFIVSYNEVKKITDDLKNVISNKF